MCSYTVRSHHSYEPTSSQLWGEDEHTSGAAWNSEGGLFRGLCEASVLIWLSAESLSEQHFILRRERLSLSVILPKSNFPATRIHLFGSWLTPGHPNTDLAAWSPVWLSAECTVRYMDPLLSSRVKAVKWIIQKLDKVLPVVSDSIYLAFLCGIFMSRKIIGLYIPVWVKFKG